MNRMNSFEIWRLACIHPTTIYKYSIRISNHLRSSCLGHRKVPWREQHRLVKEPCPSSCRVCTEINKMRHIPSDDEVIRSLMHTFTLSREEGLVLKKSSTSRSFPIKGMESAKYFLKNSISWLGVRNAEKLQNKKVVAIDAHPNWWHI